MTNEQREVLNILIALNKTMAGLVVLAAELNSRLDALLIEAKKGK